MHTTLVVLAALISTMSYALPYPSETSSSPSDLAAITGRCTVLMPGAHPENDCFLCTRMWLKITQSRGAEGSLEVAKIDAEDAKESLTAANNLHQFLVEATEMGYSSHARYRARLTGPFIECLQNRIELARGQCTRAEDIQMNTPPAQFKTVGIPWLTARRKWEVALARWEEALAKSQEITAEEVAVQS